MEKPTTLTASQRKEQERRLDAINMAQQGRGFRFKTVDAEIQEYLYDAGLPAITRVKFRGQTPSIRRDIAAVVQDAYHRDFTNKKILSDAQITALAEERGEWNAAREARIKELQERTNQQMTQLFLEGFSSNGRIWLDQMVACANRFREIIDECAALSEDDPAYVPPERAEAMRTRFQRWLEFRPDRQEEYTALYAAEQGKERYMASADEMWLLRNYTTLEAVDLVNTVEDLKDKLQRFMRLMEERNELADLQIRRAKLYSESVESRRDNTEELARVYFTTDVVDDDGRIQGKLAPTFEGMLDFPDEVISWLMQENYLFHNAIPDEARAYLETFGFIKAEARTTGDSPASAESPEVPTSKTDSSTAETTPAASSESPTASS
jgi:uncharacterized protein YdcH (DUF465 family)